MNSKQASIATSSNAKLCIKCKQFWGNQTFQWMCSSCYIKIHGKPKSPAAKKQPIKKQQNHTEKYKGQAKGLQQNKSKCFECNKKVGLLGVACKCTYVFCNVHRLPEDHGCTYNYQAQGKDNLKKQVTKLDNLKLNRLDSV